MAMRTRRTHVRTIGLALIVVPSLALAEDVPNAAPAEPFAFADFTWLTGNPRTKESPVDSKAFTAEFRVDTVYTYSFNEPKDDTIVGSSEVFRHGEVPRWLTRTSSDASSASWANGV
jgi:hypothetical protein